MATYRVAGQRNSLKLVCKCFTQNYAHNIQKAGFIKFSTLECTSQASAIPLLARYAISNNLSLTAALDYMKICSFLTRQV